MQEDDAEAHITKRKREKQKKHAVRQLRTMPVKQVTDPEETKTKKKKKKKNAEHAGEEDFPRQHKVKQHSSIPEKDGLGHELEEEEGKGKKKRTKSDKANGDVHEEGGVSTQIEGANDTDRKQTKIGQIRKEGSRKGSGEPPTLRPSTHTVSIAVAGSIVDNAQSLELATMLVGQIARAAVIFRIDEIVVFDDDISTSKASINHKIEHNDAPENAGSFMVRILEYMEVPQYLRRALIPQHYSLRSVGRLPPLDAPHHLRKHEWLPFREGVVLEQRTPTTSVSYVNVGLDKEVLVDQSLKPGTRVTVDMGPSKTENLLRIVGHKEVRRAGIYWGYKVRYASCLSAVFEECPFEGKYDYCIGTSEHGEKIGPSEFFIPHFKHLLIAFGGLGGLEESAELDKRLKVQNMSSLFQRYLNTCPNQGSRTIRTEEALLISLQYLQTAIERAFISS